MNQQQILILLGPPGSGKGTQSKRLATHYHLPQISTGDLFRQHMKEQTEIGKKVQQFIQMGQLVPDEIVMKMLFDRISQPDCSKGYLLDGFPRTVTQAETLFEHLGPQAKILALCLQVSDEEIVQRALARLVCEDCGAIYNENVSPPFQQNICDLCHGKVYRRSDDEEPVIRERLRVYHSLTQPLIQLYDQRNVLKSLNGSQLPQIVYEKLCSLIDESFFEV